MYQSLTFKWFCLLQRQGILLFLYIVYMYSFCLWHTGLCWTFKANISWQSLLPKIPKWSLAGTQHWVLDRNEYLQYIHDCWFVLMMANESYFRGISLAMCILGREIPTWLTRHRYNHRFQKMMSRREKLP